MKKCISIAMALSIAVLLLAGCSPFIRTTTLPTTGLEYDFTGFTRIDIGDAFKLEVTPADSYSIEVIARESDIDDVEVTVSGDTLKIGLDWVVFRLGSAPRVKITMPELRGLTMSGASEGTVKGFSSSNDFDLSLSGASELEIDMETGAFEGELSGASELRGRLTAASSDIMLSGASESKLAGSGGDVRLELSGASNADMADFLVDNADIRFTGASDGSLQISGRMDAVLSGASELRYGGDPTLGELDVTGGSSIERR